MNKKNNMTGLRINALALAVLAAVGGFSAAVNAELYVSPVVSSSQSGGFDPLLGSPSSQPAPSVQVARPAITSSQQTAAVALAVASSVASSGAPVPKPVVVQQPRSGLLLRGNEVATSSSTTYSAPIMKYGKNIPLSVVFDKIVPKYEGWTVNIEDGLGTRKVSWNGGDTWKEVLSKISNENHFTIFVNESEKAIGASVSMVMAENLAHKQNQIWKLETSKTLKENLIAWAAKAGWSIQWDQGLDIDYPITNGAVLLGSFAGKGGVVDKVIYSLRNQERPLTAVFYKANNVVLIKEAGFKQENANK